MLGSLECFVKKKMSIFQFQHRFLLQFMSQGTRLKVCRRKSISGILKFSIAKEKIIILLALRSNRSLVLVLCYEGVGLVGVSGIGLNIDYL